MLRKALILVLLLTAVSMAYMGDLHVRFAKQVPTYLEKSGYTQEAIIAKRYIGLLSKGAADPDNDYPNLKIPENMMPEWLKAVAGEEQALVNGNMVL